MSLSRVVMTVLAVLSVFATAAAVAAETIAADSPLPSVLGMTYQEVHQLWGEPRYIKVAPHDGDTRYAYFTLREWQRLASLSPATQGEDVYVHPALSVQVHLRYRAVHDAANRFTPEYRVAAVTYVFQEPTPLSQVAELLQRSGEQGGVPLNLAEGDWYIHGGGWGRTALVHWPQVNHPAAEWLTPFRADPPVTLYWELGLSVPATTLDQSTPINYVIERLDQFLYNGDELQVISSPFAEKAG